MNGWILKNYKASTHEKFRKILKIFYKDVFGKNEFHPDSVNWFSTQIGKEKKSQERDYKSIHQSL
ncbi:MAG: hypothetical protein ACR2F1_15290 [Nitrososphaeraceae archaeon]